MPISDIGPDPQSFDLEQQTVENPNYRTVAWSGKYLQLTLMSIPEGDDIGLEMHPETDQFLRLDAGRGRVQMGSRKDNLDFDQEVSDGWCILVPAGTWHNVTNIGNEPMRPATTMTNLPAGLYSRHQQPTSMDEGCPLRIHPARVMPGLPGESKMGSSPSLSPYLYSKRRT
jgi:mannose-6-phosphate isomerase-like protein (cupin superfamily)